MTGSDTDTENNLQPDPNVKEQDKGIIKAFAREDHQVLTNSEIAQHVSLSNRQVRRRLDKLADQGIIGKRVAGGVKLAWLEKDVKEPITVQYPLLTYVRDRVSVQLFLLGIMGGIVSVLVLLSAAISIGYDISISFVSREQILVYGVLAATVSALFIIVAALTALVEKLIGYFGIDLESRIKELRK